MMSLRYLALGDSYTIGEGVATASGWPCQLAATLRAEGVDLAPPEIIAASGWSSEELDAGIDAAAPLGPYDLVSLLIGVNDQYRGRPARAYRSAVRRLLARAVAFAGHRPRRVMLVAIPDWGVTAFGRDSGRDTAAIAEQLDAYNAIGAEEAACAGVHCVHLAAAARACGANAAMLGADGLHPSALQYARWTRRMLPVARAALTRAMA